jgi:hypothetical protein
MKKRHTIDYYMDNHVAIAFCKICSYEGDKLLEDCPGPYQSGLLYFKHLTREEFDKQIPNRLDCSDPNAK